jgi:hypothetical protein
VAVLNQGPLHPEHVKVNSRGGPSVIFATTSTVYASSPGEWGNPATVEHLDHIYGEITNHLIPGGPIQGYVDLTEALTNDPDPTVQTGARQLHDRAARWLPHQD